MRVLYAAAHFTPGPGGADLSAHSLLRGLRRNGIQVNVLTDERSRSSVTEEWRDGMPFSYATDADLTDRLRKISADRKPDFVFTQSRWAGEVTRCSNEIGFRSVFFIHDIDPAPRWDLSEGSAYSPSLVVTNSPPASTFARTVWAREPFELHPLIFPEGCVADHGSPDDTGARSEDGTSYITMITPVREKGGELFRDIAAAMPDRRFRAVRGWKGLSKGSREFIEMGDNVRVDGPFPDLRSVYASTRLLLVPTLAIETFGRVAVEGLLNGIPVLVAESGALPWVVADGGSVVASRDTSDWVREIASYDDPETYRCVSNRASKRARSFDADAQISGFVRHLYEKRS